MRTHCSRSPGRRRDETGSGRWWEGYRVPAPSSLFLFAEDNRFRRFALRIIESSSFEFFILMTIIARCVVLALEEHLPMGDKRKLSIALESTEPYFTAIFCAEFSLKVVAMGFVVHKGSYLRFLLNMVDFVALLSSTLRLLASGGGVDLGMLRALRLLQRLWLAGNPSVQLLLRSIVCAMLPLLQMAPLVLFAVLVFAIGGMELYSGAFHSTCRLVGEEGTAALSVSHKTWPCTNKSAAGAFRCAAGGECRAGWVGPDNGIASFDSIALAMLTVFQCMTMEGWTSVMNSADDALGSSFNWAYFVPLIFLGSFTLNLGFGVFAGGFARELEREENRRAFVKLRMQQQTERELDGYLGWICKGAKVGRTTEGRPALARTSEELEDLDHFAKDVLKRYSGIFGRFRPASERLRTKVRRMVKTEWFCWLVISVVGLSTACAAAERDGQPPWLTAFLSGARLLFLAAAALQMAAEMLGLGLRSYFRSALCVLDCVVVCGSALEMAHEAPTAASASLSVLRPLRLLRIFKVTAHWARLRRLALSLRSSLRWMVCLLLLLLPFVLVFTLLGMELFGGSANLSQPPGRPYSRFDSFPAALGTVFQVLTGGDWHEVMHLAVEAKGGAHGGGLVYSIYFVILVLFGKYFLLNISLAIVVNSLGRTRAQRMEGDKSRSPEETLDFSDDPLGGPKPMVASSSLFLLSPTNPLRKLLHNIVQARYFKMGVMVVICMSSAALAAEDPLHEDSKRNQILQYTDYVFTGVFTAEMILKILDKGLLLHPGSYCRDLWNVVDGVVLCCALAAYAYGGKSLKSAKSLRVLRLSRPLKTLQRIPKLKALFGSVTDSLKDVFSALVVYFLLLLIFAAIAVQLFKGRFFYCTDKTKKLEEDCQGEFFVFASQSREPTPMRREWLLRPFNFESIPKALLTLFVSSTGEGWPVIRQSFEDSTPFSRIAVALFHLAFFIVFPFVILNLFAAMLILTFREQGEAELSEADLDKNQMQCIHFALTARPKSLFMPTQRQTLKRKIWRLCASAPFEYFILAMISAKTIVLMVGYHVEDRVYTDVLRWCTTALTAIFAVECILKMLAFGARNYFKDGWNRLDFFTVVGSIAEAMGTELGLGDLVSVGFVRLFRVARLGRLLRQGSSVRWLLHATLQSFKALPYVCVLVGVLLFVYAVVGMQAFGSVALRQDSEMGRHRHFQSLASSLLLLLRCATGEARPDVLLAAGGGKDSGSLLAVLYFTSFVFLSSFLVLKLFVAVIVDNFDCLAWDWSILSAHQLDEFVRAWAEYDPAATGRIHHRDMYEMLRNIAPPVGFGRNYPYRLAYKQLIRMNMPMDEEGRVHFTTTLFALVREALQIKVGPAWEREAADEELRRTLRKLWPAQTAEGLARLAVPPVEELGLGKLTVGKLYAALLIAENRRARKVAELRGTAKTQF